MVFIHIKKRKLSNNDVFDLGNNKNNSSLPMLMKMVDEDKMDINDSLSVYLIQIHQIKVL